MLNRGSYRLWATLVGLFLGFLAYFESLSSHGKLCIVFWGALCDGNSNQMCRFSKDKAPAASLFSRKLCLGVGGTNTYKNENHMNSY